MPKSYVVEPTKELADDVWYDKILTLKQIRASQTAATRLEAEESKSKSKSDGNNFTPEEVADEKWSDDQGSEIKSACKSESDSEHEGTNHKIER